MRDGECVLSVLTVLLCVEGVCCGVSLTLGSVLVDTGGTFV